MSKKVRYVMGSGLVLVIFLAEILFAQEEGGRWQPTEDPTLLWAGRGGLVLMVIAAGLVLFTLLLRKDRLMESSSKWMLFLGLCILPLPVVILSGAIGMEGSKEVAFCHSCHLPMDPFVNDMLDPASESLAALHYKNRYMQNAHCWNCHSDYGIGGTIEAKTTGMVHMYKYTTDQLGIDFLPGAGWHAPIELYNPDGYNWTICLECHGDSAKFTQLEGAEEPGMDHVEEGIVEAIESGEFTCTECHGLAHPEREERSTK
jgi:cytochrome c nitrite reductase small subunit